jgi:hypothetical protein
MTSSNVRPATRVAAVATAAAAAAIVGLSAPASADEVVSTWTGAVNQSWTNPLNWSPSKFFPDNGSGGNTYLVRIDDAPGIDSVVDLQGLATISGLTLDLGDRIDLLNATSLRLDGDATNNGLINLQSSGAVTQVLVFAPEVTLDGTGVLRLNGSSLERISGQNFGNRLINGADHTIFGGGSIGLNTIAIDNAGTIEASERLTFTVDPNGNDNSNTGVMAASASGVLVLRAGTFDNTGGLIRAAAGAEVRFEGGSILGGTVQTEGDGAIRIGSSNGRFENVTSLAFVEVENARVLQLAGTIINDGFMLSRSTGSVTQLVVDTATVILQGTGELRLGGNQALDRITGTAFSSVLVHDADHAIRGGGNIGQNVINIENAGLIEADVAGQVLDIDPNASLINTGVLRATADATLQLFPAIYTNTGALIEAEDAGSVILRGAEIIGGDISSTGTGSISVGSGNARLDGVRTFGTIDVETARNLNLAGVIENEGLIRTNANGSVSQIFVASPEVILTGTGEVRMGGSQTLDRITGTNFGFSLVNQADHAIRGGGNVGQNVINIDNQGLIEADDPAGALVLDPNVTLLNSGSMRATAGSVLQLEPGTYQNAGGVIEAADGAEVQLLGPDIVGGDLLSAGSGRFLVGGGNARIEGLQFDGVMDVASSRTLSVAGTLVNDGLIRTNADGALSVINILSDDTTLAGDGELRLGGNTSLDRVTGQNFGFVLTNDTNHSIRGAGNIGQNVIDIVNRGLIEADDPDAALTIDANASLENLGLMRVVDGSAMSISPGAFTQAGEVVVETGGTLDRNGTIAQSGDATITVDGQMTVTNGSLDIQGGSLRGVGTVAGTVLNGGFVQPGLNDDFTVGTLTVDGTFDQGDTGTLFIQIGKAGNDRLDVTGTASLGGSLLVGFEETFVPVTGTEYVILTAGDVESQFIFANCPVGYVINYGDEQVSITITEGISIADLDCNGVVDFNDLLLLLPAFGPCPEGGIPCRADVDASGEVDFNDLLILLSAWD